MKVTAALTELFDRSRIEFPFLGSYIKLFSGLSFLVLWLVSSPAVSQSWNPSSGSFDGGGGFTATETSSLWIGPQLSARNGGQLDFVGDAEHNGATRVESGTSVVVGGALNHSNSFQTFAVGGDDGQGGFSSLTIGDVLNSSVTSSSFNLQNTALSLNSASATGSVLIRSGAQLNILEDFLSLIHI